MEQLGNVQDKQGAHAGNAELAKGQDCRPGLLVTLVCAVWLRKQLGVNHAVLYAGLCYVELC
jgi:hypothetical protein